MATDSFVVRYWTLLGATSPWAELSVANAAWEKAPHRLGWYGTSAKISGEVGFVEALLELFQLFSLFCY